MTKNSEEADGRSGGLGTFAGVFTPSVLTILGIILFLRIGYIVGSAGVLLALLIVIAANAISLLTSFSVAGIATNLRVKGGGDYYVISRTLGVEFGGALGLVLFLAQSVSIGFYTIGFAEAAAALFGSDNTILVRSMATMAMLVLLCFAWKGSDWATRFQYLVMALIVAALISFGIGVWDKWDWATLRTNFAPPEHALPFWTVFAIFFPAVTGFTQGISMSGDLRDPSTSIPRGTFLAVALSFAVYLVVVVALGATLTSERLATDFGAMKAVSVLPPLIIAGVFAATLSSALASFLGAPRILQSLAKDRVFKVLQPFAAGSGKRENPRRAVLLTAVIAMGVIALGDLNLIASIVSMFFLLSYALLNYATYYEARTRSPSFRPTFSLYRARVSLLGSVACVAAMLAIDVTAGVVAVAVVAAIYQYVRMQEVPARWADSRRSYHLQQVREHLLAAAAAPEHARDWRPQLLVFSDDKERRERILRFASWIEGGSGITIVVKIIAGQREGALKIRSEALECLAEELENSGAPAFPLVIAGDTLESAVAAAVQAAGVGAIRSNTAIVNWRSSAGTFAGAAAARYAQNLTSAFQLGCNLLIFDATAEEWKVLETTPKKKRRIDIWWSESKTGDLMLMLAYLMVRSEDWAGTRIRVLVAGEGEEVERGRVHRTRESVKESRIGAEVVVVEQDTVEMLCAMTRDATLVFVPFDLRNGVLSTPVGSEIDELLRRLPMTVLTLASQELILDSDPDEGEAGEVASASDDLSDAVREMSRLRQAVKKLRRKIGKVDEREKALQDCGENATTIKALLEERARLKGELSELVLQIAPQRERLSRAERRLQELGIEAEEESEGLLR